MKTRRALRQALLHAALLLFLAINIVPILWMLSSAVKPQTELFSTEISFIPKAPTLSHFVTSIRDYGFLTWVQNSAVITLCTSFLRVAVSFLAAFGLCYYRTRYNAIVFYAIIATMVVPFQVTMIPNYILISRMRLVDTWWSVVLPNIAHASTFFFLRQHIRGIPRAYYEVSMIEGARSFWAFRHVVFGLCKGAVSAMLILAVIDSWNLYFWPLLVLRTEASRTVTIGLKQFIDHEMGSRWGPFMATATLASVPVMAAYWLMQRNIIEAFVGSGLKG